MSVPKTKRKYGKKHRPAPMRPALYVPAQVWTVEALKVAHVKARLLGVGVAVFSLNYSAEIEGLSKAWKSLTWHIALNFLTWTQYSAGGQWLSMRSPKGDYAAMLKKLGQREWDLSAERQF